MAEITKEKSVWIEENSVKQLDEIIVEYKKDTGIQTDRKIMIEHIIETIHTIIVDTPICL